MTFGQLRTLLAVVDQGGFTAAGASLGMMQPAVSRTIASLEAELGAPLLVRGREGIVLTEAGVRAVHRAREALRQHDLLRADVAEAAGLVTGALLIASFPSATARLLPPRLRAFASRHPQVEVRLFEGTDQEVEDWIARGVAEVGMVTLPCSHLEAVPLAEDEMVAVLPSGHALASGGAVTMGQLAAEPFILSTGGCEPLISAAARAAGVRLRIAVEAREVATILAMVGAGLGVSIVPTFALPADPGDVATLPLNPRLPRALGLAARSLADVSPAARAFLDLAIRDPQAAETQAGLDSAAVRPGS